MSFKYAYKPGFNPSEVKQRAAAQYARQYFQSSSNRAQQAINARRAYMGKAPMAPRGFGSVNFAKNRERKYSDINTATYAVNTTGTFTLCHIPDLGSDFNDRIGRKTVLKSIYIRGRVQTSTAAAPNGDTTTPAQLCRLIIFVDNQPNGAAPSITDLLVEALPSSQLNANNRDRFRIIKDKEYAFDPVYNISTATQARYMGNRQVYPIKLYKKLNVETIFNGTNGGSIGDINTGALYMLWLGSTASGATDAEAMVSVRCRFDDM